MRSVLIDTSLLLLLIVGRTDKQLIDRHQRTRTFVQSDYDLLVKLIRDYHELWGTSHCLAEVSDFLKQSHDNRSKNLLATLSDFSFYFRESHIHKTQIFADRSFLRLGVADTGIVRKSQSVSCSVTIDLNLYQTVSGLGRPVINFNHYSARYLVSQ